MECAAYGTEHHGKSAIEPCKLTATTTTVPRIRHCLSCTSICGEATLVFRLHANLHTGICTRSLFDPEFLTDRWQHAAAGVLAPLPASQHTSESHKFTQTPFGDIEEGARS